MKQQKMLAAYSLLGEVLPYSKRSEHSS